MKWTYTREELIGKVFIGGQFHPLIEWHFPALTLSFPPHSLEIEIGILCFSVYLIIDWSFK